MQKHRLPVRMWALAWALLAAGGPVHAQSLPTLANEAIRQSLQCLERSVQEVGDTTRYPNYATPALRWKTNTSKDWTSGFYPGCLWYAYELGGDARFAQWARAWTTGIAREQYNKNTHDLGFRFLCTFGNGLRLAVNDAGTAQYKSILLTAAATADSRFSPLLGMYPSDWDKKKVPNTLPVVVDVMMNLELLLWAAQNGGDTAMRSRCIQHARNTWRHLVRPDGGTWHVARFDNATGAVVNKGQLQGDTDSSTWSRGQAWMVYGYTVMYRYTRDTAFLHQAQRLADYFLAHVPASGVANWDFQSAVLISDASASAIVASALFELQSYVPKKQQKKYMDAAQHMLTSLCRPPFFSQGNGTNCLLLHSTQYYRETDNTDVPASFADYYFLEALVRYKKLAGTRAKP